MPTSAMAISADVMHAIDQAKETDNQYIIDAVVEKAIAANPAEEDAIRTYVLWEPPAKKEKAEEQAQKPITVLGYAIPETDKISGSLEGGVAVKSGNSDTEDLNAKAKIAYETEGWKNILELEAENSSDSGQRTDEEYKANLQSRYKLGEHDYVFGELDWVKDRFSGYDYRMAELLGYGNRVIDEETYWLELEAAVGMRQSKPKSQDRENNFIQKLSAEAEWQALTNLTFGQKAETEYGDGTFISSAETFAKTKISETLALKFSYELEHISDVPAGTKKLDTTTKMNVLYDF